MANKGPKSIIPGGGFFGELSTRAKLIVRLFKDKRVSPFLKILPVASLAYLVMPDLVPFVIDDAVVIWLGTYIFVELCPQDVVQEHLNDLRRIDVGKFSDNKPSANPTDVVDGEFEDAPPPTARKEPGQQSEEK